MTHDKINIFRWLSAIKLTCTHLNRVGQLLYHPEFWHISIFYLSSNQLLYNQLNENNTPVPCDIRSLNYG
ncbi:hypothetical protein NDU88_005113 [Pleurodeles waltl]|uniref:Uncharacterized protein n=1 Tax=Pleurodeles waltl TaxID=8319 RepID=A0AAV7RMW1_PLEWA|nr:hypothetical protein NDU88_005113 [Pleurodeles waltl]